MTTNKKATPWTEAPSTMPPRRSAPPCSALATVLPAQATEQPPYAPVDQPGPSLSVPQNLLSGSLQCSGNVSGATRDVVLLIPGTTLTPEANYDGNVRRGFLGRNLSPG